VIADVNRSPTIFMPQDATVSRQQDRHRIGEKQQPGSDETRHVIQHRITDTGVLQINGFHQLMDRRMCVVSGQPDDCRCSRTKECRQWLAAKAGKGKIEPHDVRLHAPYGS
jgi:hypothetical protein